jgi:hypothetical protein
VSFMGRCCSEDEESAESVCSTDIDLTDDGEGAEYLPTKQVVDHSATSVHPAATSQGIMTECLPELEADPPSKLQEEESQPEQSMLVASTGMQAHCSHDIDRNGLEPEHMIETGHIDPILSGSLLYKPLWAGQSPTKYESKYFWFAEHPFWPSQLKEIRNTNSERTLKAIAWSTQTNTGVLCFSERWDGYLEYPQGILNLVRLLAPSQHPYYN